MNKAPATRTPAPRKGLTHGISFWLRTGKVNPSIRGYKKIQKYLQELETQLVSDCGGLDNLTAAKEILIRSTIRGYGVVMLAEMYASKYSVVRPDQAKAGVLAFQPVLERGYIGILAQVRANLIALGLERREPKALDLLTYVRETYPDPPHVPEKRPESDSEARSEGGAGNQAVDNLVTTPEGEGDDPDLVPVDDEDDKGGKPCQ